MGTEVNLDRNEIRRNRVALDSAWHGGTAIDLWIHRAGPGNGGYARAGQSVPPSRSASGRCVKRFLICRRHPPSAALLTPLISEASSVAHLRHWRRCYTMGCFSSKVSQIWRHRRADACWLRRLMISLTRMTNSTDRRITLIKAETMNRYVLCSRCLLTGPDD